MIKGAKLHSLRVCSAEDLSESDMKRHEWQELAVILRGRYRTEINGQLQEGAAGTAIYYPALAEHKPRPFRRTSFLVAVLQWYGNPVSDGPLTLEDRGGRLRMLVQWLEALEGTSGSDSVRARQALLVSALHETVDLIQDNKIPERLERTKRHMLRNIESNITLSELASRAGLSPSHYCREFHRKEGKPPMRHLQELRVKMALDLILGGEVSVRDAARRVGFKNPFYLSTLIKRYTGTTASVLKHRGERRRKTKGGHHVADI